MKYLPAYVQRQNTQGNIPTLTEENWEDCARAHSTTPVSEKVSRLLSLLDERSRPATPAPFDQSTDFPLLDSPDPAEASYVLNYVLEEGYVYFADRGEGRRSP